MVKAENLETFFFFFKKAALVLFLTDTELPFTNSSKEFPHFCTCHLYKETSRVGTLKDRTGVFLEVNSNSHLLPLLFANVWMHDAGEAQLVP